MKRVLILAYDFPPYVSVGGLRPYSWFKYLKEFGYEPIVITRQWQSKYNSNLDYVVESETQNLQVENNENGTIIRTPYKPNISNRLLLKYGQDKFKLVRKLMTGYYELAQFYINTGPKLELYKAAKEYLGNNQVDLIIATGEPFVLFRYASKLSDEFNVPWIADYRDPWSQNKGREKLRFVHRFDKKFESKAINNASAITTVTKHFKDQLEQICQGKPVHIIPNGYDNSISELTKDIDQNKDELTIAFVGTIYNWHPWRIVLEEFNTFLEQTNAPKFRLVFYGINNQPEIELFIENLGTLRDHISFVDKLPNEKLALELAKANVFLLFNYYAFIGTKIYDYLAIKRRILFCFANDNDANDLKAKFYNIDDSGSQGANPQIDVLNKTKAGLIVENRNDLKEALDQLYNEFMSNGKIACNSTDIEVYSRRERTKLMAELFDDLLKAK